MNFSEEAQKSEDNKRCQCVVCFLYRDRFIKTSVTKIIYETAPEIKVLSNHMDFRNMPVVFGVAVVISLALNGKW